MTSLAWCAATLHAHLRRSHRLRHDRGEGVISAAIAVLIVALIGALMWVGFQTMWQKTESKTDRQLDQIGGP